MAKTGIIGHRGAAGLALENSLDSIAAALDLPMDAIEFDVRLTRDGQLVVLHDEHTGRIAERQVLIRNLTLTELQGLKLKNGQKIPTLSDVLDLIGNKLPVVIDVKDAGSAAKILQILDQHPDVTASFTSLLADELDELRRARPESPIYLRDRNPFRIVRAARQLGAEGITINKWFINPLTWHAAQKNGLKVFTYTVDSPRLIRILRAWYPGITICTNHPERLHMRKGSAEASEEL